MWSKPTKEKDDFFHSPSSRLLTKNGQTKQVTWEISHNKKCFWTPHGTPSRIGARVSSLILEVLPPEAHSTLVLQIRKCRRENCSGLHSWPARPKPSSWWPRVKPSTPTLSCLMRKVSVPFNLLLFLYSTYTALTTQLLSCWLLTCRLPRYKHTL